MAQGSEKSWWREIVVGVAVTVLGAVVIAKLGLGEQSSKPVPAPDPRAGRDKEVARTTTIRPHQERGAFHSVHGQTGQVSFGVAFVSQPKVRLEARIIPGLGRSTDDVLRSTIVIETTTAGFRWKNTAEKVEQTPADPNMGPGIDGINLLRPAPAQIDGELGWVAEGSIEEAP